MDTFMGRYRNVTFLAAAIFLQILGLAIQIKRSTENESSRLIRLWAVSMVAPLEKGIVRVQGGASGVWHNYFYLRGVRQENRDLREQIEQLRLEQVRLKQDAEQARRLQSLLGFKEQFIGSTKAAQVIGSSGSEQSRLVYIDKGSNDGIKNEMPVITADGVVGKVLSVIDGSTSQVLLINDQQSGVGAILEQSRLQGVLKGRASGELVIDKIMTDEEVKPGDRILTSGGDRIFPKGLPVGTVAKITKGPEFLQITIKPAATLTRLEEVLVITKKEEHESTASTAAPTRAADILAQRLPSVPDKPAVPAPGTPAALAAKPATTDTSGSAPPKNNATTAGTGTAVKPAISATANDGVTPRAATPVSANGSTVAKPAASITAPATQELKKQPAPDASVESTTLTNATVSPKPAPVPKALPAKPPETKPSTETKPSQAQPKPSGDTPQ
jgi:rod shape-determining protein MreC